MKTYKLIAAVLPSPWVTRGIHLVNQLRLPKFAGLELSSHTSCLMHNRPSIDGSVDTDIPRIFRRDMKDLGETSNMTKSDQI